MMDIKNKPIIAIVSPVKEMSWMPYYDINEGWHAKDTITHNGRKDVKKGNRRHVVYLLYRLCSFMSGTLSDDMFGVEKLDTPMLLVIT